jgi:hypothetical protein
MSQSAFERVLVMTVGLTALLPPVVIATRLATANLSAVAVGAEIEDSATRGAVTHAATNNEDQDGEPF